MPKLQCDAAVIMLVPLHCCVGMGMSHNCNVSQFTVSFKMCVCSFPPCPVMN